MERTNDRFADYCFVFATVILFFLFANLFAASVVFLFHGSLSLAIVATSAALTVFFAAFACKLTLKRYVFGFFSVLIAVAIVGTISILIARSFYDISYDGQTYQQEAVIQLADGWNPVYTYLDPNIIGPDNKWIDYYPKSSWITEASIYLATHEEQSGKALNTILILVSAALIYAALMDAELMNKVSAFIVALVLAFNPVSVYQSLSFYLDGQLMSVFLCLCAIFLIIYKGKRRIALITFFVTIPFFINLKFTAVVDAIFLIVVFMAILWMREDEKLTFKLMFAGLGALALGGLVIGASPYITNLARYQTPFYPLEGAGAIDLKPFNVPGNFINKSSPEIFFLSFFSQSAGVRGVGTTNTYKIPFTYSTDELATFHYTDPEEGGFGPLFGGAIILGFLSMIGFFIFSRYPRKNKPDYINFQIALALMLLVVVISVIDPISSLARYVPQAYLLAIIPVILLLTTRKRFPIAVAYVVMAVLIFNTYLIAQSYVGYNLQTTSEIGSELTALRAQSQVQPIYVLFNEFKSNRIMLDEAGIRYISVDSTSTCPDFKVLLPENTTEFCVP